MDDPVDASKAYADKARLTDIAVWIDTVFLNRTNDPDSPLILIMQRIAENDPSAHLLELKLPKTVHLNLPAEHVPSASFTTPVINRKTGYPWIDPRKEGELLHPTRFDAAAADVKKKDALTWSAQYQQDPTPATGTIFKATDFRLWSWEADERRGVVKLPDSFDYKVISADFNNLKQHKARRNTDFACVDVWGALGRDRYLLEQYRQKMGVAASVQLMLDLIRRTEGLRKVLIERAANGLTVISTSRVELGFAADDDSFIKAVTVQGESKIQRAEAANVIVSDESRWVYIGDPEQYGDMYWWLQEITGFPGRTRDDRVDTMTMALNEMEKMSPAPVWSMSLGRTH
jgi:phage terminase large subunit-like protein